MRIKLGWQLGLTYLLLIALSIALFGYFTMAFFEQSFLDEKKASVYTHANILADSSAPYLQYEEEDPYLSYLVREYGEQVGNRVLVLNSSAVVVADSAGDFNGRTVKHPEILTALKGGNAANPRLEEEFGWVLYLAVPVTSGKQVIGSVFMAADINPMVEQLDKIRLRLVWFSLAGGAFVFLISLFVGTFLTKPVKRIISAANKIASGEYGVQVRDVRRNDELGDLTRVFNQMSAKIMEEDTIRKQFVADASHELRSPVAAMKALLESAPAVPAMKGSEGRELLADLNFEADKLGRLVEDLLVLSRIEGDRRRLNLEETSVGELVEAVKRAILPMARQRCIEIETVHDGDVYWPLDGEKMFRALLNLTDNAIKYSLGIEPVVVGFKRLGERLSLSVANVGEGIPAAEIPHIFNRFYRIDKTRSRKTGGWGLGLSIVKEIVDLHQGTIRVTSEPGGQTVFTLEIPMTIRN